MLGDLLIAWLLDYKVVAGEISEKHQVDDDAEVSESETSRTCGWLSG